jgi:peptidoglycan/xylan/chitin deacetylase (PgdA/CDA1 family)
LKQIGGIKLKTEIVPDQPMVALTFDDGPSSVYTPAILDILNEHNSSGTFFVLGTEAEQHPEILQRMVNEGHEIGNHSYSHLNFTLLNDAELTYQVETPQVIVERITGKVPTILRPPYGFFNDEVIQKIPFPIVLWSVDTVDWQSRNADYIYNIIINNVKDGDFILMHDIYESTLEAVRRIVPELINQGYQLVTVSEMADNRGITLQPGNTYHNLHR